MQDIANIIYTKLSYLGEISPYIAPSWTETNPEFADLTFKFDEFDLKNPNLQILLTNLPDKKSFVMEGLQKVEHQCRITIFMKPIKYDETSIETLKTTFLNMKTEIDRIINNEMFSISSYLTFSGWDDKGSINVGRGILITPFQSQQTITCYYYIFAGEVDSTSIPVRVSKITIGITAESETNYDWIGITDMKWEDSDPWVMIGIAAGPATFQHVNSIYVKGEITVKDLAAMNEALFGTEIDVDNHCAIESDGTKWRIGYFNAQITTNTGTFNVLFSVVRIQSVHLTKVKLGEESAFIIKFIANSITYDIGGE